MNYQPSLTPTPPSHEGFEPSTALAYSLPALRLPSAPGLLQIVRRRLELIIGTIAVVSALGILITFQLTPTYEAEAVIVLNARTEKLTNVEDVVSPLPLDQSAMGAAIRSEIDVLQSRPLVSKVIDKLNLMNEPEFNPNAAPAPHFIGSLMFWMKEDGQRAVDAWIRGAFGGSAKSDKTPDELEAEARSAVVDNYLKKLKVTNDGLSLTIRITMQSKSPALAQKIINSHADFYLSTQLDDKFDATKRVNTWLTQRVDAVKEEVQKADRAVQQYREQNNLIASDKGATVVSQQLAELNSQLVIARADRNQTEARLKQVRALLEAKASIDSISEVLTSTTIQQLRQQETALVSTEADMASRYTEDHPALIKVRAQLRDVRGAIRNEIQKIVVSMEENLQVATSRQRSLEQSVDELTQKVSGLNMASVKLNELQNDADASRTLFQTFLSRFKETAAGPAISAPDARIVSPADVPLKPIYPKKSVFLPAAFLISLIAAAALVFTIEKLDSGIYSADGIENLTGMQSLGIVPVVTDPAFKNKSPSEMVVKQPLSGYAEAIRIVRTALRHSNIDQPPKIVLITSSVPGEGKTSLSLAMARSAAKSGLRTLLIDGDMRRPQVAAALAVEMSHPGIVGYLEGEVAFDSIISQDPDSGLSYILAPPDVRNSLDLISSQQFSRLLGEARERYDAIYIDSSPVLAVADPMILARLADTVIFVVHWGKTPAAVVLSALKALRTSGAVIAGPVLSRVDIRKLARHGYGGPGSYYGRYPSYYTT